MLGALLVSMSVLGSSSLPVYKPGRPAQDWLVENSTFRAEVSQENQGQILVLSNGLVSREFQLTPNFATIGLNNLMTGASLLRTPEPEAILTIDGKQIPLGGLIGQPDRAFLLRKWLPNLGPPDGTLAYQSYSVEPVAERMPWVRERHHSPIATWPPHGVHVVFHFADAELKADVHYEFYDGVPIFAKWVTFTNESKSPISVDGFVSERLGLVEADSIVDKSQVWQMPPITIATDYSFGGMALNNSNRTTYWETDPEYTTQVNYDLQTPCVLEVKPPLGPGVSLAPGQEFKTFHTFELVHDSSDRERRGLAVRKLFRTLAPWSTENPVMLHLTSTDPKVVRTAIDQAAAVGFEMVIFSFGSGLNMEDVSEANLQKFKDFHDYAKSKGLEMGGYSLLASRHIDDKNDVISPKTGKPGDAIFGYSPCLGSQWGIEYFQHIKTFLTRTGFELLEHDGSYPGDVCASTDHPGHKGLIDSQWTQFNAIATFYRWCRERGIYLNVPDNYFLSGSNKTGMGYRETNWSLPRQLQHIHARQNLFDGTWEKTPSMGWMMVPLVEYQGGGDAATIEPLKDHLPDYGLHLANNFGYGVQACYRGSRLYDSPETMNLVKRWVTWFKDHRDILESDVIHLQRADGEHLDGVLHVNPNLATKAMAVIYNPSHETLSGDFELPLYYSGLRGSAHMTDESGNSKKVKLDGDCKLKLHVELKPQTCGWFQFK